MPSLFCNLLGAFRRFHIAGFIFLTLMSACQSKDKATDNAVAIPEKTVEQLYHKGMDLLQANKYESSVEIFEQIEREHPYSQWAVKAQEMAAFAYYNDEKYDDVVNVAERFIKLHPGHRDVAYMYYLRAMAFYDQIAGVEKDQGITEEALQALREIMVRFPESSYAKDAKIKIDLVRDHLAGKELEIGRFYLKKGRLAAAINRFKTVVNQFETTSHTPEALYRLTAAYYALGVKNEAQKYAAVLGKNYPSSKWYHYSYKLFKKDNAVKQ